MNNAPQKWMVNQQGGGEGRMLRTGGRDVYHAEVMKLETKERLWVVLERTVAESGEQPWKDAVRD